MRARIEGIEEAELRDLHDNARMSPRELAEFYEVARTTIRNRMKEYGIIARPVGGDGSNRKYSINEDFFKVWTLESAWMYGWAIGDGNYTNDRLFIFALSSIDKEVLYKFREVLDSEHPIKDYKQWNDEYQKWIYTSRIQFSSVTLVKDLKQINYYDVPLKLFAHFTRGFFEAEGSVSWHKDKNIQRGGAIQSNFTQGDRNILDYIHTVLQETGIVRGGSMHKNKDGWQLSFSVNDSFALYDYIYNYTCRNMFLKRKKEKFEELIRRYEK